MKCDALPSTPYMLVRLDVTDHKLWLSPKDVDIGMGETSSIFGTLTIQRNSLMTRLQMYDREM